MQGPIGTFAGTGKADAATQLTPRANSPYNTITDQGSYIHWNRTGVDGSTWLITQRGALGSGGFVFADASGTPNIAAPSTTGLTQYFNISSTGNLRIGVPVIVAGQTIGNPANGGLVNSNGPFNALRIPIYMHWNSVLDTFTIPVNFNAISKGTITQAGNITNNGTWIIL